jgi:hypothetical protein
MTVSQSVLLTLMKPFYSEFDMHIAARFRIVSGFHAMGFHFQTAEQLQLSFGQMREVNPAARLVHNLKSITIFSALFTSLFIGL